MLKGGSGAEQNFGRRRALNNCFSRGSSEDFAIERCAV